MGFVLFIVSSILKWILAPIAYIYGSICSLLKGEFNAYQRNLAVAKDQYGNALCCYLFNQLLIRSNGRQFGNVDETISSVIGKNKVTGTLLFLGRVLDYILNKIEPNHSIKAIEGQVNGTSWIKPHSKTTK